MKAANFDYVRPTAVDEAVRHLKDSDGMGKVLAGGQSLVPMMNLRLAQPAIVVDLSGLDDLRAVSRRDDATSIGALVTHAMVEDGRVDDPARGMMRHVARNIAYRGVRNRGTVAGSLAHADPAGDWPTALLALGASVEITGPGGTRTQELREFLLGAFTTALEPEEVVTAVSIPVLSGAAKWGYYKVCRKVGEFADSIGAIVVDPERGHARAVLGATDGAPIVLENLSDRLLSDGAGIAGSFDKVAAAAALDEAGADFDPIDRQVHAVVLSRAVRGAFAR